MKASKEQDERLMKQLYSKLFSTLGHKKSPCKRADEAALSTVGFKKPANLHPYSKINRKQAKMIQFKKTSTPLNGNLTDAMPRYGSQSNQKRQWNLPKSDSFSILTNTASRRYFHCIKKKPLQSTSWEDRTICPTAASVIIGQQHSLDERKIKLKTEEVMRMTKSGLCGEKPCRSRSKTAYMSSRIVKTPTRGELKESLNLAKKITQDITGTISAKTLTSPKGQREAIKVECPEIFIGGIELEIRGWETANLNQMPLDQRQFGSETNFQEQFSPHRYLGL